MAVTCDVEETRAIALVGMSLSCALAGVLKRMNMLGQEALEDALEAALSGVENSFSPDDRSAVLARQLLDLMGGKLAKLKPEPEQPRLTGLRSDVEGRPARSARARCPQAPPPLPPAGRATQIAAAKALLRERRERLDDHQSRTAEIVADDVRRLESEVFKLTRFLKMHD